jgi:site-specific recombinase XerD
MDALCLFIDLCTKATYLATDRQVSASTQNQALSAITFLYKYVLQKDIALPSELVRPTRPIRLPTVLTHQEAMSVIIKMSGVTQIMTKLLYGSGLRLMECMCLRIKDVDFGNHQLIVRDGKGEKDRITILPDTVLNELQRQIDTVKAIHRRDLKEGYGDVSLPYALERKYTNAPREFVWQYVFPASVRSVDPVSQKTKRHHMDPTVLQKASSRRHILQASTKL